MLKTNYIIREVEPEVCDFSWYFQDDGLTELGGDFCNNLFIIPNERGYSGFNMDIYKDIQRDAENLIDAFHNINTHGYASYKEAMQFCGIDYNSYKCHALKEWAKTADEEDIESIAAYLTIITGKKWETDSARGYCQGDYVEMVYCPEHYKDGVQAYGEIWLGAGKEFCVTEQDDDGNEIETVGGYIIADCQARSDEDYKKIVSAWAGIDEKDATLEMIDDCYTVRKYKYRTL